jgi:hypothetical protein
MSTVNQIPATSPLRAAMEARDAATAVQAFAPDAQDLTVFFRPLPATAAALRLLGAGLGRRRSRARGALISNLTRPFASMSRAADRIGVRLVEPTL